MSVYRQLAPYGLAIGATAIALLLQSWLRSFLPHNVGSFFYIAVMASTCAGGW